MANDFIGVSIDGLEETKRIIAGWPQEAKDAAGNAAADYLIERFRQQPSPRYVTRERAYGRTWKNARQMRWFMGAVSRGEIPGWFMTKEGPRGRYKRTQGMRKAWRKIGRGEDIIVVNETIAAVFTMGDKTQSRHEALVGWKTIAQHIQEGGAKLAKRMQAAGEKALKKLGAR